MAWGVLPLETGIGSGKDPLFMFPHPLHKTSLKIQQFLVPQPEITQHFPIFHSKCLILANFQFLFLNLIKIQFRKPQFGPKISSESNICQNKTTQFIKPQIWC